MARPAFPPSTQSRFDSLVERSPRSAHASGFVNRSLEHTPPAVSALLLIGSAKVRRYRARVVSVDIMDRAVIRNVAVGGGCHDDS